MRREVGRFALPLRSLVNSFWEYFGSYLKASWCVLIAQRLVEPTSFPKQRSCLVQEFDGMNFLEESDVVAQVGEERVLGEFGVLDFFAIAERPKPL